MRSTSGCIKILQLSTRQNFQLEGDTFKCVGAVAHSSYARPLQLSCNLCHPDNIRAARSVSTNVTMLQMQLMMEVRKDLGARAIAQGFFCMDRSDLRRKILHPSSDSAPCGVESRTRLYVGRARRYCRTELRSLMGLAQDRSSSPVTSCSI